MDFNSLYYNSWLKKVAVASISGCMAGEFMQLVPKSLKIIKGDPDLSEEINRRLIGLKVVSFLGPDDMKKLPKGHRVVFFRDIVAALEDSRTQEMVELLEQDGFGPDDAVDFAPEQFRFIN